jgi:hypothetical protein
MEQEKTPLTKRRGFAFVVVGLLLVIVYLIGSANKPATTDAAPAPQETQSVEVAPELTTDDIYLQVLHSFNNPIIEANTDADLIALGKQVCSTLDSGATVQDIMLNLVGSADGTEDDSYWEFAGAMIGGGVSAYCPEYSNQIG